MTSLGFSGGYAHGKVVKRKPSIVVEPGFCILEKRGECCERFI